MTKRAPQLVLVITALFSAATLAAFSQDRGLARVPAPIGPDGQVRELYSGSYALLVGMSQYQDRVAWTPLDSIREELRTLQGVLRAHGFADVQILMDLPGAELRRAVVDFNGQYGFNPGNRLFYFFAGHGYTLDNGERGYFVTSDAPDPTRDEQGFRRVSLSMQQIATWAQEITARHALFAFDSCFSGTIFRTRERQTPQRINSATAQPVRQFLSAGTAGEPVPARSVFTPVLIRGLNGAGDIDGDGLITGTELGNFVQREVVEYRIGQTPQTGKIRDVRLDQGDIVFAPPGPGVAGGGQPLAPPLPPEPSAPKPTGTGANPVSAPIVAGDSTRTTSPDRLAIEETLNEYRRAYEARNVKRLQLVFPSVPNPAGLATAFEEAREVLVGMSPPEIRLVSESEATARTRLNQNFVPRVGVPRSAPTRDVTFTLEKVGGRWLIVRLR